MGKNKALVEIFDGRPVWKTDRLPLVQMHNEDRMYGSCNYVDQEPINRLFVLKSCELKVMIGRGKPYNVNTKCMDAVFEFIRKESLFEDAVKIIHIRYKGEFGYVGLQAYVEDINEKK
jgi:hypothetical protein